MDGLFFIAIGILLLMVCISEVQSKRIEILYQQKVQRLEDENQKWRVLMLNELDGKGQKLADNEVIEYVLPDGTTYHIKKTKWLGSDDS